MKIVVDIDIPYLKGVLEPFADIEYYKGKEINSRHLQNADALIIRTRTKCNAELLHGSNVKIIASATIGYDHIDTEYCAKNNIRWINAPGCNSGSVMQYFIAALLYWAKSREIDLFERTLGVVGVGNVGKKIVRFADIVGLKVLLNDPPRERLEGKCSFVSLEGILRECDIITFHVPLTYKGQDKTYHLLNSNLLNKLNKNSLVVNTSRGEVIDQSILKKALESHSIDDYIFDVWENEPGIDQYVLENAFIGTPHIAGYSQDGKAMGTAMSVQAVSQFFDFPLNDWYPHEIAESENNIIDLDAGQLSFQEALTEAILKTYPVWEDNNLLKSNPDNFENLRSEYRIRREFQAYQINLSHDHSLLSKVLRKLGFKVEVK